MDPATHDRHRPRLRRHLRRPMIMEGGSPGVHHPAAAADPGVRRHLRRGHGRRLMKDITGDRRLLQAGAPAPRCTPADDAIDTLVSLAERARREGLLALEDAVKDVDDPFLKRGLQLAIDGTDPEELRDILEAEIAAKKQGRQGRRQVLHRHGRLRPDDRHHRHRHRPGPRAGEPRRARDARPPRSPARSSRPCGACSRANVIWLPIGSQLKRISELEVRPDGAGRRGHHWPSRPAPTRALVAPEAAQPRCRRASAAERRGAAMNGSATHGRSGGRRKHEARGARGAREPRALAGHPTPT